MQHVEEMSIAGRPDVRLTLDRPAGRIYVRALTADANDRALLLQVAHILDGDAVDGRPDLLWVPVSSARWVAIGLGLHAFAYDESSANVLRDALAEIEAQS